MKSALGLRIIDNCAKCELKEDYLFCNLPPKGMAELDAIRTVASYPQGTTLFAEGGASRGVFVLCDGRAKLTVSSSEGKTLILGLAGPGDVLGLSATVSNLPYEVTAELLEPCQVNFIRKPDFVRFLTENGEVAVRVAQQLSKTYLSAYEEVRTLGLASSAAEKLARLLLSWAEQGVKDGNGTRITMTLTHEELSQSIGSSRETVTRLLGDFKKSRLIEIRGASLILRDRAALEAMVKS